jgi:hypothetical protein
MRRGFGERGKRLQLYLFKIRVALGKAFAWAVKSCLKT